MLWFPRVILLKLKNYIMLLKDLKSAISQIAIEKDLSADNVIEVIIAAMASAYKKEYGHKDEKIEAQFDEVSGEIRVFVKKLVVNKDIIKNPEEATETAIQEIKNLDKTQKPFLEHASLEEDDADMISSDEKDDLLRFKPERHILLKEAKKVISNAKAGDSILFPLIKYSDYGRIAAQTAKQVISQRLRELERDNTFKQLKAHEGKIISGFIQRIDNNFVYVNLGRATGILPYQEQIPGEYYKVNQRLRFLVSKVEQSAKGPSIFLSRASTKAMIKIFEQEVPEIAGDIIEIKSIAREPGLRAKVAVFSNDPDIDPIGSCVGQKGTRISTIINEFNGEKIDIIEWSENPSQFISSALSPAKTLAVDIVNKKNNQADVYVAEDQQSLAIGKNGQNVRLAAKLTGWKIDIKLDKKSQDVRDKSKKAFYVKPVGIANEAIADKKDVKKPKLKKIASKIFKTKSKNKKD